jgi:hypothetical protein
MQSLKLIYVVSLIIFWYPSVSVAGKASSSTLFVSAEDMFCLLRFVFVLRERDPYILCDLYNLKSLYIDRSPRINSGAIAIRALYLSYSFRATRASIGAISFTN